MSFTVLNLQLFIWGIQYIFDINWHYIMSTLSTTLNL